MNININNKGGRKFAPWTALLILGLLGAIVLAAPTVALAQITGELSQECDFALIGSEHTITATVAEGGAPGASEPVLFYSTDSENYGKYMLVPNFDENGRAEFTYTVGSVGHVDISLIWVKQDGSFDWVKLNTISTSWTDDDQDPALLACMGPSSEPVQSTQTLQVGGRGKLNVNKRGAMSIMVCSDGELDLHTVVPETVTLADVAPVKWFYKDRKFCPGGQDGFVDLTFMFKNRDMVKALEESVGEELADGDQVELELSGSLNDGTAIEGTYELEIINKNKHRKHHVHKIFKCKKKVEKKAKKNKMARK